MVGRGGVAADAVEIASALNEEIVSYVDQVSQSPKSLLESQPPVFSDFEEAIRATNCSRFFVAVGENWARQEIFRNLSQISETVEIVSLIHPEASLGTKCEVGPGSLVAPLARLGNHVSVGLGFLAQPCSVLGHGSVFGDFCSVSSGVSVGGQAIIGSRVHLGLNAAVREKVSIGSDTVVGATAFVNADFGSNLVLLGSPARAFRSRTQEEPNFR